LVTLRIRPARPFRFKAEANHQGLLIHARLGSRRTLFQPATHVKEFDSIEEYLGISA
jgi:hypothetical protein